MSKIQKPYNPNYPIPKVHFILPNYPLLNFYPCTTLTCDSGGCHVFNVQENRMFEPLKKNNKQTSVPSVGPKLLPTIQVS